MHHFTVSDKNLNMLIVNPGITCPQRIEQINHKLHISSNFFKHILNLIKTILTKHHVCVNRNLYLKKELECDTKLLITLQEFRLKFVMKLAWIMISSTWIWCRLIPISKLSIKSPGRPKRVSFVIKIMVKRQEKMIHKSLTSDLVTNNTLMVVLD